MSRIRELKQKRAKAVEDARKILKKAEDEKRSILNSDEEAEYNRYSSEAQNLQTEIQREERQVELELSLSESGERAERGEGKTAADEERTQVLRKFLRGGFRQMTDAETRVLQANSGPDGGYLIPPEQFVNTLLTNLDATLFIRRLATKYRLTAAASLGIPSLESDAGDAEWVAELATGNFDEVKFGKRVLYPHPLAKKVKISKKLISLSTMNIEDLVRSRFETKFRETEEKAFLIGHGTNQPLGIYFPSADGIPTSRDVVGGSTTALSYDGLIDAYFGVKPGYRPRAEWLFHSDAVKALMKLKDGENRYIWQTSVREGAPDTLMGRPVNVSDFNPNTFTAGKYVGMFADFSQYFIADVTSSQLQRLDELYAETNQVGFIMRAEVDGMPGLPEAFARIKLADS